MSNYLCLFMSVLLACSSAAAADNRVRTVAYEADAIVRIIGKSGIQSTIQFASDERIENVAVGDSSSWQITPNRRASLLFVKPLVGRARTNMTVVTDKRTYLFDLVAGEQSATVMYSLKFLYSDESVQPPPEELPLTQAAAPPVSVTPAIEADDLNFDWKAKGKGRLIPQRVFDDGAALYLAWKSNVPLPAVLSQDEDRHEGPLSYRTSGEYIVISPVPSNVVLRYGRDFALLWPATRIRQSAPVAKDKAVSSPPTPERPQSPSTVVPLGGEPPRISEASNLKSGVRERSEIHIANLNELYRDNVTDDGYER